MDYFAVSLPDFLVFDEDLSRRNRLHCHYMMALGYLGLGNDAAVQQLAEVLALDVNHQGATLHLSLLQNQQADRLSHESIWPMGFST
jgi:glutaminase